MQISLNPIKTSLALALLVAGFPARATTVIGPWVPIFKGVDYSVSTNTPGGGGLPRLQVVHAFRVDLADPDIRLLTTPPLSNYVAGSSEVGGLTTSDFLRTNRLQAALNANFFDPGNYYLPAGTPMDVFGLAISEGVVVSTQGGPAYASAILFDTNNQATIIPTNWPAASTDGIYTAVSGKYPLVIAGTNVASRANLNDLDPRTIFGLSQDRRFLYLVGIDGRQGAEDYSDGANDFESAEWLLMLGAYDGINMDGGGSTLLVMEDSTGIPIRLSKSSAVADSGRERTVGSHFGVYAKPLPGFINDVVARPDTTTAEITWTTVEPSTTEVQYGVTTAFGSSSGLQPGAVTNHVVQLTGLTPDTGYYFRALSTVGTQEYVSSTFYFVTTNHVTTNRVLEITNSWKYTATNLTGVGWTTTNYNDSGWSGPGAGLLWVDVRPSGPNPAVQPKGAQLPVNPNNNGFPYVTYYFRTHFALTNVVPGGSLAFSGYIDDGAVFYLNGAEIYRLRMPAIANGTTLATNFPCSGDATCLDEFKIPMASLTNLAIGDNVLAVEVHNYNLQSADITFGIILDRIEPVAQPVSGFINNVAALPDETTAEITWTTVQPSTTEVQYGVTTNLGSSSGLQPANVTNHFVQLTGLTPDTGYHFRALSSVGAQQYVSSNFFFVTASVTTNVVATNRLEITSPWKFTATNLSGVSWAGTNYNDSAWSGPGAGLLWVDLRPGGANTNVVPKGTQLPADPGNPGFPSVTYYFRTHLVLTNIIQGGSLAFSGFIDDGAVFYLNGAEIYRLRMPAISDAASLATNSPCTGDATCLDEFTIPINSLTNLVIGDNVFAVEVHNQATNSTDITFGISMDQIDPVVPAARIDINYSGNTLTLSWDASGFVLQSVDSLEGQWTNVQGTAVSPYTVAPSESKRFFRLKK